MDTIALDKSDTRYPSALLDLERPPHPLWVRGSLAILQQPCVAIVGTRRATAYGERVARDLSGALARAGACVISGLARGIDAAAHRGALDTHGSTGAVLGTGLDVVFPRGHAALQQEVATHGVLVSELNPRDTGHRGSFPNRNRIIAALAKVTIIVEAGVGSGALLTAREADTLGRTVAVVPGPIDVPQAKGSNDLLNNGVIAITSIADALAAMGLTAPVRLTDLPEGSTERRMWNALCEGPADLDSLCSRSALPVHEGMAAVTALELRGLVECDLSGEIRRL